jgi:hypothetical protein
LINKFFIISTQTATGKVFVDTVFFFGGYSFQVGNEFSDKVSIFSGHAIGEFRGENFGVAKFH